MFNIIGTATAAAADWFTRTDSFARQKASKIKPPCDRKKLVAEIAAAEQALAKALPGLRKAETEAQEALAAAKATLATAERKSVEARRATQLATYKRDCARSHAETLLCQDADELIDEFLGLAGEESDRTRRMTIENETKKNSNWITGENLFIATATNRHSIAARCKAISVMVDEARALKTSPLFGDELKKELDRLWAALPAVEMEPIK